MYPDIIFLGMDLYSICIAIGVLAVLVLADKIAVKRGFSVGLQKLLIISIVGAVVVGFLGGILFQAVYHWIDTGEFTLKAGMTFYGGLIFGAGTVLFCWFVLSKPFKVHDEAVARFKDLANMAACLIPLAHGFGRLGCLFAGCCYGKETSSWFGVEMYGVKRVPIQLFEALFLFALSAVIFYLFFKQTKSGGKEVPLLPVYLIVYGVWRFVIEYARGDERGATIVSFLSPSQLIAVLLIAVGIGYFVVWYCQKKNKNRIEKGEQEDGENGSDESV